MRDRCRSILVTLGALTLGSGVLAADDRAHDHSSRRGQRLFVWAGDQARQAPDFLAVVDFDEGSSTYGKVLTTVPLPGPGETSNEPHHVGLSADGKTLATGGLLSVLKGQREIFFFDVSNPDAPLIPSRRSAESAITTSSTLSPAAASCDDDFRSAGITRALAEFDATDSRASTADPP